MKMTIGLLLITVSVTFAQSEKVGGTQSPGVTVLSSKWEKYVRRTRLSPSDTTAETREETLQRIKGETSNDPARSMPGAKPIPVTPKQVKTLPRSTQEGYRYRATVKNSGVKPIKAVNWIYIFTDPASGEELARHGFHTRKSIRPGQVKELVEFQYSPPSKVVSTAGLEKSVAAPFGERVVLARVEYADGSVWQSKEVD